jgi:hypothetical protein
MTEVETFLSELDGIQAETALYLHQQIMSYPGVLCKLRYKIPFYDRKHWVCYINPLNNNKLELVFLRGSELIDFDGTLQPRGRKMVKGIIFDGFQTISFDLLHAIIQEALNLDEKVKYTLRKK